MRKHGDRNNNSRPQFVLPPAYPFSGRELLADLRHQVATQEGHPLGFAELGRFMGQSTSTVHFWFSSYRHPHLVGFMSLLERLSPVERQLFIEAHCRVFPSLLNASLAGHVAKLSALMAKTAGLTVVIGVSDRARTSVLTGFGHSWRRRYPRSGGPAGIDIHRPREFVPIDSVYYIDETLPGSQIRELALSVWPRLATSRTQLLVGNRLWHSVKEIRNDLLRIAEHKHVVLAEESMAEFADFRSRLPDPTHTVTVSDARQAGAIRITCRRLKSSESR